MKKLVIFASGSGTNAENIIKYFSNRNSAKVVLVLSNKREAPVFERAAKLNVPAVFFDRHDFYHSSTVRGYLELYRIDYIVLAGFLWLVPEDIIESYRGRIINIHPALLPAYGGKGMYGEKVHSAVIEARDEVSGITIHHVNRSYDEGDIIFQARCRVYSDDTPESLAGRIHELEYLHFPRVIEEQILKGA